MTATNYLTRLERGESAVRPKRRRTREWEDTEQLDDLLGIRRRPIVNADLELEETNA